METNKIVPIVGVVVVVGIILILFFAFSPAPVPAPAVSTATSSLPTGTTTAPGSLITNQPTTVSPANPATPVTTVSPSGLPAGVTNQTVWRAMTLAGWGITFSSEVPWQVSISKDANGNPDYISLGGNTSAVVVSKDLHIATPSAGTPSITTQEIAGMPVQVSKYDNPQPGYVYSLSFQIPAKGSTYYFLFQSSTSSMSVANNFESLIQIAK